MHLSWCAFLDNGIKNWINNLEVVATYAKDVEMTLLRFSHKGRGVFDVTWYCHFPECEFKHSAFECSVCFLYRHSLIIKNLC